MLVQLTMVMAVRMFTCQKCNFVITNRPNFCPSCGSSLTYSQKGDLDPLLGRTIAGTYELLSIAGEGAMGKVYRAHHRTLDKPVAVKVLRKKLVNDITVVRRFEREAQAASRLDHPNCISILGFGQEEGEDILWMAMEFVEGKALSTIIAEESPLPAQRVLHIFAQVCDALDEAHAAKIVHRDLKPANVICFDHRRIQDFVKVLDFGIAKVLDQEGSATPLTREGIVCGTPAFMSPEQVQGLPLDNRSDLFSLGIILYQTLTGKLPFLAESAVEVATKIVMETPTPPSQARSDWTYPPEFEQIVLKLLSKNRDERYAHAMEVKQALEQCLAELKERRDAALDFSPDELADMMGPQDTVQSGTDTVRLDDDMVSELLDGLSETEKQVLSSDQTRVVKPAVDKKVALVEQVDEIKGEGENNPKSNDEPAVASPMPERKSVMHGETIELPSEDSTNGARSKMLGLLIGAGALGAALYLIGKYLVSKL